MPTTFQSLENTLPRVDDRRGLNDRVDDICGYLFQLVQLMRYTLENLGADNFNDTEFKNISDTISAPIYKTIEDTDKNVAELNMSAKALSVRLSNAEGDISSLTLTASSLSSRISDAEGNISSLTQTASSLSSRIGDAEGDISSLSQTASSLASRISDTDGNVTSITQTLNSLTLSVSNSGTSSTITLIKDGIALSSDDIYISGFVTFSDLSTSGSTTINGDNITTGTVSVDLIKPNNGVTVQFDHPLGTPSLGTKIIEFAINNDICVGSSSSTSKIASSYPDAVVIEGTSIFYGSQMVYDYKNGSYGFYDVITAANIDDYLSDIELTAKFG